LVRPDGAADSTVAPWPVFGRVIEEGQVIGFSYS
jgi:hypothetical protein